MQTLQKFKYILPVYWAPALVNNDYSGLDDAEAHAVVDFLHNLPRPKIGTVDAIVITTDGESFFTWHPDAGLPSDCLEYTFLWAGRVTKHQAAKAAGLQSYDVSIPLALIDRAAEKGVEGRDIINHFVYSYDRQEIFGELCPITRTGLELLPRINQALGCNIPAPDIKQIYDDIEGGILPLKGGERMKYQVLYTSEWCHFAKISSIEPAPKWEDEVNDEWNLLEGTLAELNEKATEFSKERSSHYRQIGNKILIKLDLFSY